MPADQTPAADAAIALDARIAAVRRFNRFYTKEIGVLREGLADSPFSLTEARVLFELAQRSATTASELARDLDLDPGYLSRILRRFEGVGLLARSPSPDDARQSLLRLTAAGEAAFAPLNQGSREEIATLLSRLPAADQERLVAAMSTIETLLAAAPETRAPFRLRTHQIGDMGWVIHRHAVLYAREHGWDGSFEAMVAEVAAAFLNNFDAARERCFIAEIEGGVVGSAFLVRASAEVAKIRLVYVEPRARGLGIGRRLIGECLDFARAKGYRRVTLWTNNVLLAARSLYESTGFRLVAEEPHRSFGQDLIGETWERDL